LVEKGSEQLADDLVTLTLPSPLVQMEAQFKRTAIIGVGLIGGSIGLRMKQMEYGGHIVGHDRLDVLDEAISRGAIDEGAGDLAQALLMSDLVVLATPADETLHLLPTVLRNAKPGAIVTDTAPTKTEIVELARSVSDAKGVYIGGHPLAGSNRQGIANADANLFDSAYWLLTPTKQTPEAERESLAWWVRMMGSYPLVLEAPLHDRLVAMTTHVPFVIALALSRWAAQRSADEPMLQKIATGNFQTLTSLAALPYEMWNPVVETNRDQIAAAMADFLDVLGDSIRRLQEGDLPEVWQEAHLFQKKLARERPGDWDANCDVVVTASDRPGSIAKIAGLLAAAEINIRDIGVLYVRERKGGTLRVGLETRGDARRALELLVEHGFSARLKE
jgi:prephenate dehydrogenase